MVTCAQCHLRFDTHAPAKRDSTPWVRSRPLVPRSPLVVVKRTDDALVLEFKRSALEWVLALFLIVGIGGGCVVAGTLVYLDRPEWIGVAVMWWAFSLIGIVPGAILLTTVTITVDRDSVRARGVFHKPSIARGALADVVAQFIQQQQRRAAQHLIVAVETTGRQTTLMSTGFPDVAAQVIHEIDRALEQIPAVATRSSMP
jgi:hypothetical protein